MFKKILFFTLSFFFIGLGNAVYSMQQVEYFNTFAKDCHCVICLDTQCTQETGLVMRLDCKHEMHTSCMVQWCKESITCPLCKSVPHNVVREYSRQNPNKPLVALEVLKSNDNVVELEELLKIVEIDPNKEHPTFGTPLGIAAHFGRPKKLLVLSQCPRVDVNKPLMKGFSGITILPMAVAKGSYEVAMALLDRPELEVNELTPDRETIVLKILHVRTLQPAQKKKLIKQLLKHPKLTAETLNAENDVKASPVLCAYLLNLNEIQEILLQDPRVNPELLNKFKMIDARLKFEYYLKASYVCLVVFVLYVYLA